jgi:DNA polymerase-3 subunit chi
VTAAKADFYIVSAPDEVTRLKTACVIAGKAYDQGLKVTVLATGPAEAAALDEMLWTFRDSAFVPHGRWPAEPSFVAATPVLISDGPLPGSHRDVLINLGVDTPADFTGFDRICEVVGSDAAARRSARGRWRCYSDAGIAPNHIAVGSG